MQNSSGILDNQMTIEIGSLYLRVRVRVRVLSSCVSISIYIYLSCLSHWSCLPVCFDVLIKLFLSKKKMSVHVCFYYIQVRSTLPPRHAMSHRLHYRRKVGYSGCHIGGKVHRGDIPPSPSYTCHEGSHHLRNSGHLFVMVYSTSRLWYSWCISWR